MIRAALLAAAVAFVAGCDGSSPQAANQSGLPLLGELWEMAQISVEPDSDGDHLPDDVERLVGTKTSDRDTDRDGLPDNYEIFGDGYFDPGAYVPDQDGDGIVAPIDGDDDGDGVNDGEVIDTDGDGVANYLETYGYTYEWLTGRFVAWDGDPDVRHFFTDPIQRSTDQDAFSDGTEASGAVMDVAVQFPGDDPLVPAYPNIVINLDGYSVTLNETITYTDGGSLAKGSTWNRETTETHSNSTEKNWEVGINASLGFGGGSGVTGNVGFHANYGEKYTNTQTTSTAVSVGGSVLSEKNWSRARSMNPTDAARIKLLLKVHNFGTACASNIVPTLTLRIGGLDIATFEPGNAQVNMLVPGGEYPPEPNVHWVVDSIDTGTGVVPISLTMDELRALERGAPVSIAVNQLKADVMLANGDEGFVFVGDTNEYMARCDAVGANLRVDIGDGSFVHYLVYADDSSSAPRMTLKDALRCLGLDDGGWLTYFDKDGTPRQTQLEGYTFLFDQQTLIDNGFDLDDPGTPPYPDFEMGDMVLYPGTCIFMKAPRDPGDAGPVIYYAYVDPQTGDVKACAADYQGVDHVEMVDKEGAATEMIEEMTDCGFFYLIPDPDYVWDGTEKVVVTNVAGEVEERLLEVVFYPQPQDPVINFLTLDIAGRKIYANVTNPMPQFPIKWVRAMHPGFDGGYLELEEPVNAYEDPDGWVAQLPTGWSAVNIKVVAFVTDGVYAEQLVSPESVITPLLVGSADLYAEFDWTATDEWWDSAIDLDTGTTWTVHKDNSHYLFPASWEMYHWWHNNIQYELAFNQPFAVTTGDFDSITRDQIIAQVPAPTGLVNTPYSMSDIFLIKTSAGNYAKVALTGQKNDSSSWGEWRNRKLSIKYVVYSPPQAYAGPDQDVVVSPLHKTVTLNGGGSAGANEYAWTLTQVPAGSSATLTNPGSATPSFTPDVAGDYYAELEINNDATLTDTVKVTVAFPSVDAGGDRFVTFNTATDDSIQLDGTGSTGADTWTWEWDASTVSAPTLLKDDTSTPEFVPDVSGSYVLTLTINKGEGIYERTETVTITVTVN